MRYKINYIDSSGTPSFTVLEIDAKDKSAADFKLNRMLSGRFLKVDEDYIINIDRIVSVTALQ